MQDRKKKLEQQLSAAGFLKGNGGEEVTSMSSMVTESTAHHSSAPQLPLPPTPPAIPPAGIPKPPPPPPLPPSTAAASGQGIQQASSPSIPGNRLKGRSLCEMSAATNHVSDSLTNIMCLTTCPNSLSKMSISKCHELADVAWTIWYINRSTSSHASDLQFLAPTFVFYNYGILVPCSTFCLCYSPSV